MKIQISPVSVFPSTATQVEFLPAEITFGQSARCQYILQDADGANLTSGWVEMTPDVSAAVPSYDRISVGHLGGNFQLSGNVGGIYGWTRNLSQSEVNAVTA